MFGIGFELLLITQIASRAILLNTNPPGSLDLGSREDIPRDHIGSRKSTKGKRNVNE